LILVKLENQELTAIEFSKILGIDLKKYDKIYLSNPSFLEARKELIIKNFLITSFINADAKKNSYQADEKSIEDLESKIRSQYPNDHLFRLFLVDQGITFNQWRQSLEDNINKERFFSRLTKDMVVSDDILKKHYESNISRFSFKDSVKVNQLVFKNSTSANLAFDDLKKGKKIADLAKFYANDIAVPNVNLSNWVEKDLNDNLNPLFSLKVGQNSRVIEMSKLFYIFQIVDKRSAGTYSFEAVKNRVRRLYVEQQEKVAFDSWLSSKLKESKVFIDHAAIKSLKVDVE